MKNNIIRKITIGKDYKNDSMHYAVGQEVYGGHKICDIIDLTQDLQHMTRGSAGSSLICYLLGITDVDPIKWNIPVARFMNPMREDLPDVDIDFEHHQQGEVMQRIFKKWPGKTARLSNYVMYREKSAKKEAAKRLGAKGN